MGHPVGPVSKGQAVQKEW